MGKDRKKSNQKLPKHVYINRGRYVYIARIDGKQQKAIKIGNVADTTLADVWAAYRDLTEISTDTLEYLVKQYTDSKEFKSKKSHAETLRTLTGLLSAPVGESCFGKVKVHDITPGTIRKYLDYKNNVTGNRSITYLSSAWSWCYERDIVTTRNPCKGVKKVKEHARTRYITDDEYKIVYDMAGHYVQVAMELAYTLRMRRGETLDLRVKDLEDEGVNTRRLKGSLNTLTLWNDRLKAAVDTGLDGCLRVPMMPVVNSKGSEIHKDAFRSAWQSLMRKVMRKGLLKERFTFHDLKAKGISDFEGEGGKQLAGGHKSAAMTAVYDRKRKKVDATD